MRSCRRWPRAPPSPACPLVQATGRSTWQRSTGTSRGWESCRPPVTPSRRPGPRQMLWVGLLLVGATVALLRTRVAAEGACTLARRHLPDLLGLEVGVGQCEVDPLTQEVRLRGLSLFAPGHSTPLLAADGATVRLGRVRPLLGGV